MKSFLAMGTFNHQEDARDLPSRESDIRFRVTMVMRNWEKAYGSFQLCFSREEGCAWGCMWCVQKKRDLGGTDTVGGFECLILLSTFHSNCVLFTWCPSSLTFNFS
ncbi:hypothetical protein H1C71_019018 [Ictidomys tridecemlineatus]|nr:hypothetical protein H1C71_019018 [Ictidomys tridecemlineatus]